MRIKLVVQNQCRSKMENFSNISSQSFARKCPCLNDNCIFHKRHCHCMNPVFSTRRKSKPDVKREVRKKLNELNFTPFLKTRRGQNPVHHGLVNQSLNQCTKLNFTTKPQWHMKVVLVDTPTPLSISMTVQEKIIRSYLSICRQNRSVN